MTHVAIVGGGITGIAAALRVIERGGTVDLLEAGPRLGGTIATVRHDGFVIETGPDSFITDKPWALALCERMGLGGDLVPTRETDRRTYVARGDRLCPLPDGFLLLAPTSLWPLVRSPLFSLAGKLRMGLDLVLPRRRDDADESLAAFVRRRLGREALDRVADPLASGIYTGDPDALSLRATMPRFAEMEARHRSLILGLRRRASEAKGVAGARYGLFVSHRQGMGALVDALAVRIPERSIHLRRTVDAIERTARGWRVRTSDGTLDADGVVLACPAHVAAALLRPLDAAGAAELAAIPHASSAILTFGIRTADVPRGLPGFGFVVPATDARDILACTFSSRKWPGRAPEGCDLVRVFVGGVRRAELPALDDAPLIALARRELARFLDYRAEPLFTRVDRWMDAMPQYTLGHDARVRVMETRLAALRGLGLAGNAYHGVGIPDCVRTGEAAADAVLSDCAEPRVAATM
jgi:oxygen-dependent protoporphyrinogen oxidase